MDGVVLDIADTVAADVINAVPVPGKARADIGEIPWIGARTEYKGKTARTPGRMYVPNIIDTYICFIFSHFLWNIQRIH